MASNAIGKQQPHLDPERVGKAALQLFFSLAERWQLSTEEGRTLLGQPAESTYFSWKKYRHGRLSHDTLERISYLAGIHKALRILLPTEKQANEWLRKPNNASMFGGRTALERMLGGNVVDLADVRRYLDAQRG